ncbi:MFS transporter [Mycobacterium sp. KBS0706]|uniref:MFS transporter n=1 Tax=Mycobacterium sp. KBS0706 TaxID=2578109 RepID=UPI00110FC494|nr:MFS transporter [Mycobacterium sp. KBS0706]TSD84691.1 MFS transporter [Mycobacterium sp. KBS0706]
MSAVLSSVAALLAGVGLMLCGNGLQAVLVAVRATDAGFGTVVTGLLGSGYYAGFVLGCLLGPHLVRRAGHVRTFAAVAALAAAVALSFPQLVHPAPWIVLRGGTGFCFAVVFMVIESWLNEQATSRSCGTVLSLYTIVTLLAITIGQMLLGVETGNPMAAFTWIAIMICLAVLPIAMTRIAAPPPPETVRLRLARLVATSPVGAAACLVVGIGNAAFWSLGPVFAQARGFDAATVALFMSVAVLGGAVGQWPLGRLSDRVDRRWTIVISGIGTAAAGAALLAVGWLPGEAVIGLAFFYGAFSLPLYPLALAHTFDQVRAGEFVETSSGLLLIYAIGAVVGPVPASLLMVQLGTPTLFAFVGAVNLVLVAFTLYRMGQRARAPAESRPGFVSVQPATQGAIGLDPRAPETPAVETAEG